MLASLLSIPAAHCRKRSKQPLTVKAKYYTNPYSAHSMWQLSQSSTAHPAHVLYEVTTEKQLNCMLAHLPGFQPSAWHTCWAPGANARLDLAQTAMC